MFVDYVQNGQAFGPVGSVLQGVRFAPHLLRPYIEDDPNSPLRGRPCVAEPKVVYNNATSKYETHFHSRRISDLQAQGINSPVFNATTLTKAAWINLDANIVKATRLRLIVWSDLMAAVPLSIPGMSKMTHEYQAMSDPGSAVVDMTGVSDGQGDRPQFQLRSVPLPITHSDFSFSEREIALSRNGGAPLDTTMGEAAGRRVAETVEKTAIGTVAGVTYGTESTGTFAHQGTSTVYGMTNYTYRVTKTDVTTPLGTNPEATVADILEMRETMRTNGFFGPYVVYHSTPYDRYLDDDYFRTGGTAVTRTLRERVESIEGISALKRVDYLLTGYVLVMIQMTTDVVQAINGMDVTTVQWEGKGGLEKHFKVMAIHVPLFKAPYNTTSGIIHGTTS